MCKWPPQNLIHLPATVKIFPFVSQPHTGHKTVLSLLNWRSLAANTLSLLISAKCLHPKDHTCSICRHQRFSFGIGSFCLFDSILKYAWERVDLILAENSLRQAVGVGGWGRLVTQQQGQARWTEACDNEASNRRDRGLVSEELTLSPTVIP